MTILHFKSDTDYLNVCFERKNYNLNFYPDVHYIYVDQDAIADIYDVCANDRFDRVDNLKMDSYQKMKEEYRKKTIPEIVRRINNGEYIEEPHCIGENGKRYPRDVKIQRDVIYATMLAYPKCNNSEIARMTGASRGTVIKCRKDIENYTDIANCSNAGNPQVNT